MTVTIDQMHMVEADTFWHWLTRGDRLSPSAAIEGKESDSPCWSSVFLSAQLFPYWDHFTDTSNVGGQKRLCGLVEGCLSSLANTITDAMAWRAGMCVSLCVCVCGSRGAVCHLQAAELHRCQQGQTIPRLHWPQFSGGARWVCFCPGR